MGGDSHSRFCCKNCTVPLKRPKINEKGRDYFKKRYILGSRDWHGDCSHGHRQSPIDISSSKATKVYDIKPFVFEHYEELPEVETIHNNGHSIVITLEESQDSLFPKVSYCCFWDQFCVGWAITRRPSTAAFGTNIRGQYFLVS